MYIHKFNVVKLVFEFTPIMNGDSFLWKYFQSIVVINNTILPSEIILPMHK